MIRSRAFPTLFPPVAIAALLLSACGQPGPPARPPIALASPNGVSSDVLEREEVSVKARNMEELLRYRLPNVVVRRAGDRSWVQIRGQGSINASNEALIIVDGIQITSRGLLMMDPDEVERIQVLKDGSAAIYGMRAGNGVLVVTTRR